MTEKEKMITALPYRANDPELVKLRREVRLKLAAYNTHLEYDASELSEIGRASCRERV